MRMRGDMASKDDSTEQPVPAVAEARRGEEEEGEGGEGEREGDVCSDQELEDLLNFSLGEFGKHLPATPTPTTASETQSTQHTHQPPSASGRGSGRSQGGGEDSAGEPPPTASMQEFEDIYSEEFVAQAQAKLDEAMQILSKEDPELWQQLKGFSDAASATLGGEEERGREGERKEEGERGREGERKEGGGSIEETLEDTFRRLKESTEKIEAEGELEDLEAGLPERLMKLLEEVNEGGGGGGGGGGGEGEDGEDGEEGLVKMMDKMMSSFLFSRDVLYPFLTQTCKQYGEWLPGQREKLSPDEYSRYCKQLEVMRAMCHEFEGQGREGEGEGGASGGGGGGEEPKQNEKIIELMHQLQQYGQPPPEILGDEMHPPPIFSGGPMPADCSIM